MVSLPDPLQLLRCDVSERTDSIKLTVTELPGRIAGHRDEVAKYLHRH